MASVLTSTEMLLRKILDGKITDLDGAKKFVRENDLWFGPDSSLVDFLHLHESLSIIRWDRRTNKITRRSSEKFGTWYLKYTVYNKSFPKGECQTEILLDVDNQEEAIVKAKELWEEELRSGHYKGENGAIYPQDPRVVYEFDLK